MERSALPEVVSEAGFADLARRVAEPFVLGADPCELTLLVECPGRGGFLHPLDS